MDIQQFADIFDEQVAICDGMLNSKRKEYAGENVDVLHNFRQAAHLEQTNLRQALAGVMVKHTVSIYDMLHENEPRPMAVWEEKINDHLNYLFLLKAIVIEEHEESKNKALNIHPIAGDLPEGYPVLINLDDNQKDPEA